MLRQSIGLSIVASTLATAAVLAQTPVVRTADPITRGLKESDLPRTIKVADHVYTYEDFHAGAEKFTTTNMFVVTDEGVLVADGQGSPAETKGLVDAIRKVTPQPFKYVVICSDHGDHTAGNASFPPASPTSRIRPGRRRWIARPKPPQNPGVEVRGSCRRTPSSCRTSAR